MRREADAEMRRLIQGIRDLLAGARAQQAKAAGSKKRKQKGAGSGSGSGSGSSKEAGVKGKGGSEGAGGKKGGSGNAAGKEGEGKGAAAAPGPIKRRKDPSAGRSIESILAELAAAGLVRLPPPVPLSAYLGGPCLVRPEAAAAAAPGGKAPAPAARKPRTGGKAANMAPAPAGRGAAGARPGSKASAEPPVPPELPPLSMAQARQEVAASCVLPLGCLGLQGRWGWVERASGAAARRCHLPLSLLLLPLAVWTPICTYAPLPGCPAPKPSCYMARPAAVRAQCTLLVSLMTNNHTARFLCPSPPPIHTHSCTHYHHICAIICIGKTLLAGAVAHEAGALLFDLSPAATAGLYPGKQARVCCVFCVGGVGGGVEGGKAGQGNKARQSGKGPGRHVLCGIATKPADRLPVPCPPRPRSWCTWCSRRRVHWRRRWCWWRAQRASS